MFAAIDGDPIALDYAADAWRKTRDELGESALEESRQQYLRHAQTVWHTLRVSRIIRRIKFSRRSRSSRCLAGVSRDDVEFE